MALGLGDPGHHDVGPSTHGNNVPYSTLVGLGRLDGHASMVAFPHSTLALGAHDSMLVAHSFALRTNMGPR